MSRILTVPLLALIAIGGHGIVPAQEPTTTPAAQAAPVPSEAPAAMAQVDRDDLRTHATHLASDEMGGRYTGTEGQQKAAEYIAGHFEQLGLEPLGDKERGGGRSFYQSYPVERTYLDPAATALTIGAEKSAGGFAVIPNKKGGKLKVSGAFVFCGDGSPDEIPKGSLKRKIPVVLLGERTEGARRGMSSQGVLQRARSVQGELDRRGARLALFCLLTEDSAVADSMNVGALLPGKPLLAFGKSRGRPFGRQNLPMVFVGRPLSLRLLQHMGIDPEQPAAGEKANKAAGVVELSVKEDKKFEATNVVAYLPGAGKRLGQEAIVFSAHMDHMGTRLDGDAFNGADDNASGSSGLLDIAQAFAKGERPQRSVIFLSVSGEELGLWGSEYFSDNPTWPLARIVADINIDMIGRVTQLSGASAVSVTPSHEHPEYSTLVQEASRLASVMGIELTIGDTYYQRSDHYNFAKKGIPVVFFCDGEHKDYHKVTDHADLLDYEKMERVARLAYWTGWVTAEAKGRPKKLGSQASW